MPPGGIDQPLTFLLDRSLGRIQVPKILREHGLTILTLSDVYGHPQDQSIQDDE